MQGQMIDHYRLKNELGRGAFGVVYEAEALFDDKAYGKVALKLIEPQNEAHRASIIMELAALANCVHHNIVGFRQHKEVEIEGRKLIMLAIEFATGGTLTDALHKNQMSSGELLEVARDVASGLEFLARRGLLHRDIKPDNILRFHDGPETIWKISDLGLARPALVDGPVTGIAGTMLYMAPEMWRGQPSAASDVWALGLCLHEAITQKRLWEEVASGALEYMICDEDVPFSNDLPLILKPLIEGCLQKNPSQRWSAARVKQYAEENISKAGEGKELSGIIVSQGGGGTHSSLGDAIKVAPDGSKIMILPGRYLENLVLDKSLIFIGADPRGAQAREKVVIECDSGNALKVTAGQVRMENLTLQGTAGAQGKKFYTVSVANAHLGFKNCALSSDSLACLQANSGAKVALVDCRVEFSASDGLIAQDGAQLMLRNSHIEYCQRTGIIARRGAVLKAWETRVEECKEAGLKLSEEAQLTLNDCRLNKNAIGVLLDRGTQTHIKGGQIARNKKEGVRAERGAQGTIEECDLTGNAIAWSISAGARVTRRNNTPS